jgi:hypothetical protein
LTDGSFDECAQNGQVCIDCEADAEIRLHENSQSRFYPQTNRASFGIYSGCGAGMMRALVRPRRCT